MTVSVDVLNTKGEKKGSVELSDKVFGVQAPVALVHEVITAYLANERRGTHSTKTRGEVSGGGVKPWKQKHTGRARSGSTRSPLWRHGGIIFGPKPHSYYQAVPDSKRRLALRKILSDMAKENRLRVLDAIAVSEPKTKKVAEIFAKLGLPKKTIVVVDEFNETLVRASRNIGDVRFCRALDLNGYDALNAEQLVFTKAALDQITQRLEKN